MIESARILQIKRNSDHMIFTVGDIVYGPSCGVFTIQSFDYGEWWIGGLGCHGLNNGGENITQIKHFANMTKEEIEKWDNFKQKFKK